MKAADGYKLVNRLWYFYDDEHGSDPTTVLVRIQRWVKKNPTLDIADIDVRIGWDGEAEDTYVEGTISFTDPSWPIGAS